MNTIIHQVQGLLPSDTIYGLYPCHLELPAVHLKVKHWAENVPVAWLLGVKYGTLPLFRGVVGQIGDAKTTRDC